MPAEIGELLGNLRLGNIENFLAMADTKRTTCKQMHDAKPRGIAEALVDSNQFHEATMKLSKIFVNHYILNSEYIHSTGRGRVSASQDDLKVPAEGKSSALWAMRLGGVRITSPAGKTTAALRSRECKN